jgi:hypothetical protein
VSFHKDIQDNKVSWGNLWQINSARLKATLQVLQETGHCVKGIQFEVRDSSRSHESQSADARCMEYTCGLEAWVRIAEIAISSIRCPKARHYRCAMDPWPGMVQVVRDRFGSGQGTSRSRGILSFLFEQQSWIPDPASLQWVRFQFSTGTMYIVSHLRRYLLSLKKP